MTQMDIAKTHWQAITSRLWNERLMRGDLRRHAIDRWWNSCEQILNEAARLGAEHR